VAQAVALDDPTLSYAFASEMLGDSEGDFSQTLSQSLPWPRKRALRSQSADHEAAAVRYEQEASSAQAKADEYRKTLEWY